MVVAALLCVVMTAPSWAHTIHRSTHQSVQQQIRYYEKVERHDRQQIRHANTVFRFFENHTRLLYAANVKDVAWTEIHKWREIKKDHQWQLGWAENRLAGLRLSLYPAHHQLWMCIHGHEAADWFNRDTGHNGHYGGLQMHYDWGEGIEGYAYNYSQIQQEDAAEAGFKASHYSTAWLMGQWYHPDCLGYA